MAQKRMFSLSVVDTDKFLEMPISARLLYYELGMRADDDGFVSNWKKILLFTGLKEDDLKILIMKNFIIPFESGVIVIRHWRMNNYLQNDRIKPTIYQEELKELNLDNNNVYNLYTGCIHSIDKNSIEKNSIDNNIYSPAKAEQNIPYKEIIDYLNFKLQSNYKDTTRKTRDLIKARYNENFKLDDFKKVIDNKCEEWLKTEMQKYLRPETLFGTKFESYLNQQNKSKYNESIPDWFDKNVETKETSNQDIKELEELLKDFN